VYLSHVEIAAASIVVCILIENGTVATIPGLWTQKGNLTFDFNCQGSTVTWKWPIGKILMFLVVLRLKSSGGIDKIFHEYEGIEIVPTRQQW